MVSFFFFSLTTQGGIAGIGLGHLVGRVHDSTRQSGVEAPRLLKRSLSRLYYVLWWWKGEGGEEGGRREWV